MMAHSGRTGTKESDTLSVGELALQAGMTPRTIRYYANMGLLSDDGRPSGQRRRFSVRDVYILRFIQRLKYLGLSLGEIRDLKLEEEGIETGRVYKRLDAHLDAIEERIRELRILRKDIEAYKAFIANHR